MCHISRSKSFSSTVIVRTYRHTHTGPMAQSGPLKWPVMIRVVARSLCYSRCVRVQTRRVGRTCPICSRRRVFRGVARYMYRFFSLSLLFLHRKSLGLAVETGALRRRSRRRFLPLNVRVELAAWCSSRHRAGCGVSIRRRCKVTSISSSSTSAS